MTRRPASFPCPGPAHGGCGQARRSMAASLASARRSWSSTEDHGGVPGQLERAGHHRAPQQRAALEQWRLVLDLVLRAAARFRGGGERGTARFRGGGERRAGRQWDRAVPGPGRRRGWEGVGSKRAAAPSCRSPAAATVAPARGGARAPRRSSTRQRRLWVAFSCRERGGGGQRARRRPWPRARGQGWRWPHRMHRPVLLSLDLPRVSIDPTQASPSSGPPPPSTHEEREMPRRENFLEVGEDGGGKERGERREVGGIDKG